MESTIPWEEMSVTKFARELQSMDNLLRCSGCDKMAAVGTVIHVPVQLKVGISPSSNGRERMGVNGIGRLVICTEFAHTNALCYVPLVVVVGSGTQVVRVLVHTLSFRRNNSVTILNQYTYLCCLFLETD